MPDKVEARTAMASADDIGSWRPLPFPPTQPVPPREHFDLAREAYEETRWFHGTSVESKASIREHGFVEDRKTDGAMDAIYRQTQAQVTDDAIINASSHHYFARDKGTAETFAGMASPLAPALVRTLLVDPKALRLKSDPDTPRRFGGKNPDVKRTRRSVPADHVVGSKNTAPGHEGRVFRQALKKKGLDVSETVAAGLLRAVQSDSEDDMASDSDSDDDWYADVF